MEWKVARLMEPSGGPPGEEAKCTVPPEKEKVDHQCQTSCGGNTAGERGFAERAKGSGTKGNPRAHARIGNDW